MTQPTIPTIPVTVHDATAQAAVTRLDALLASPPLTLSVEGGALDERKAITLPHAFVVSRELLEYLVWVLRRVAPFDPFNPETTTAPAGREEG